MSLEVAHTSISQFGPGPQLVEPDMTESISARGQVHEFPTCKFHRPHVCALTLQPIASRRRPVVANQKSGLSAVGNTSSSRGA